MPVLPRSERLVGGVKYSIMMVSGLCDCERGVYIDTLCPSHLSHVYTCKPAQSHAYAHADAHAIAYEHGVVQLVVLAEYQLGQGQAVGDQNK